MSHDVFFDESTSWYSLPSTTLKDFEQIVGDEAIEANPLEPDFISGSIFF